MKISTEILKHVLPLMIKILRALLQPTCESQQMGENQEPEVLFMYLYPILLRFVIYLTGHIVRCVCSKIIPFSDNFCSHWRD